MGDFVERLTPLDLLMPAGYISALLTFPTADNQQPVDRLAKLQKSLQLVCERIPWVKGKVFSTPATEQGRKPGLEVRWAAADAPPRIIHHDTISAHYKDLVVAGMPLDGIPSDVWAAPAQPGDEAPVFIASFFGFADDEAIGLCVQAHHNVVDGFGFQELISLWSQCMNTSLAAEGFGGASFSLDRNTRLASYLHQPTSEAVASLSSGELFARHPEYSPTVTLAPMETSDCTSEVLRMSMGKIEALKTALIPFWSGNKPLTTNTVACALTWSAITRARIQRNPDLALKTVRIPMAVNGRKRLHASLMERRDPFFGNVVLFSIAEASARDVSAAGCHGHDATAPSIERLAALCRLIAEAQSPSRINAAHITEVYTLAEKVDDHRGIFPGWELFGPRDVFITSWADLDLYEHDFGAGLGKPEFVRIPYVQTDGNVVILPRRRGVEGKDMVVERELEVVVMLNRGDMKRLKEDALWDKS